MTEIAEGTVRGGNQATRHRARIASSRFGALALKLAVIAALFALAGCPVAYILWPRWPDAVTLDAPALPVTIGGVLLNVPPAAIRAAIQRRPGAQERIDLVFVWPALEPPDPAAKTQSAEALRDTDRIFVTISTADRTPPPPERLKAIYPRYTDGEPTPLPNGLNLQTFRTGTPYQNEDLFYDTAAPDHFIFRCTRKSGVAPGICLHDRRIANADFTFRFPREWIADWRAVASGIDRLIANLRHSAIR